MAGKEKSLHDTLLDGFDVKSRADGTVHTIKANGKVVGEVCVGTKKVRLNLKATPAKGAVPKSIALDGKSKTWAGGGVIVTDENVTAARALVSAVVAAVPEPQADDAARSSAAARQTVTRTTTRRTGRKTAAAA
jgi:hypothetical protein